MDKASRALSQGPPPGVPISYHALADHGDVPCSALHFYAHDHRSMKEKARSQQYLSPWEEDALPSALPASDPRQTDHASHRVKTGLGPLRDVIRKHKQGELKRSLEPPREEHILEDYALVRGDRADTTRPGHPVGSQITWCDGPSQTVMSHSKTHPSISELQLILAENVYNMGETGVILSILGSVKVLSLRSNVSVAWGSEHTSTLDTVNNLGLLYADIGQLDEAEKMY
ncbi:hypothetical protein CC78DRAFT_583856 [Lojkania enalia]|uniref:Uncharacterized protein n=1 Tax=Lojkania enalia TaxID=147567 RepID=A0A9P4N0F5_9PLEO|nr:hypothetical protein CC78DRAFT_583856 [Didymosphaeria enalia]